MSEFSRSEIEAALTHFKRLRSGSSSVTRPVGSHINQTIRSLEGRLLRHDEPPRNTERTGRPKPSRARSLERSKADAPRSQRDGLY